MREIHCGRVEAVLSQYLDLELLVVDRRSTDRTTELIADIDDRRVRLLSNSGRTIPMAFASPFPPMQVIWGGGSFEGLIVRRPPAAATARDPRLRRREAHRRRRSGVRCSRPPYRQSPLRMEAPTCLVHS